MTNTFIKPPSEAVQSALKVLKVRFDDPRTKLYVPHLERLTAFPDSPALLAWQGEMLHQLGEWFRRQGDECRANECFQRSIETFDPAETLGPARTRRTIALQLLAEGSFDEATRELQVARKLHRRDRRNASNIDEARKALRQARITSTASLEVSVAGDDDRQTALDELVHIALRDSREFCLREQHDLVEFLIGHTRGADKRALRVRQLEINARRRKMLGVTRSATQVVIDHQLHIASSVLGSVVRKDRTAPRH